MISSTILRKQSEMVTLFAYQTVGAQQHQADT